MRRGEVEKLVRLVRGDEFSAALDEVCSIVPEKRSEEDLIHCQLLISDKL
jgi:hypothetical protein